MPKYKMMVEGNTPQELKQNLLDLATVIGEPTSVVQQTQGIQIGVPDVDDLETDETQADTTAPVVDALPPTPDVDDLETEEDAVALPIVLPPVVQSIVPAPSASVDLDAKGLPWDQRIHATTKAKLKDGSWKGKRGVEPATIVAVEAELRGGASPAPVVASFPQSNHDQSVAQVGNVLPLVASPAPAAAQTPSVAPTAPATATTAAPPVMPMPVAGGHTLATFKSNLVPVLADLVKSGKLTPEYVNQLKQYFGVDEIWKVNDQQLSEMFDTFASHGLIAKV